ncbi:hypothetical protein GRX03_15200 [Halovenus sp. WSH3]|uniref:Uncharacterized protein n=1 Tax=Halovenus carboxidivorans TaxID=2692199 RepID=A0A6B0T4A7_9EURY|nr:hypothetical protein [Halovenus carboxidivorans]MXR52945.1 hypothetical protein [Halovenus carboxidivorans]
MSVTAADLDAQADRIDTALECYDRIVDAGLVGTGCAAVPAEIRTCLDTILGTVDSQTPAGVALANRVQDLYLEGRRLESRYVERARERDQPDWETVVDETETIRQAAVRVHATGYDPDSGYELPERMCPAALVSMNAGSSPVQFEDRIVQYETVVDEFGLSPEVVYYPGSGHDVSPSAAVPRSRVIYADVDTAAMADLRRAGYEAVAADATGHDLSTRADVIIFRNAGLIEEPIVRRWLRPGGWVLANNHLESADHVAALREMELFGVVSAESPGSVDRTTAPASLGPTRDPESTTAGASNWESVPSELGAPLDTYVFRKRPERDGI